ncbi:MAG: HAMP domain-containing histidine kinase [Oscillospiraceae bacterium]|nr:HAMP domain-containing histidine kinase [Oscillospiraceae bacterium]
MENIKKRWTAIGPVKIACFALIIIACFSLLNRGLILIVESENARVSPEVVFVNLDSYQYFHNNNMWRVQNDAWWVLQYGSEEAISAGLNLRWERRHNQGWSDILQSERMWQTSELVDIVSGERLGVLIDEDSMLIAGQEVVDFAEHEDRITRQGARIERWVTSHDDHLEEDADYAQPNAYDVTIVESTRQQEIDIIFDVDLGLRANTPANRAELEARAIEWQLANFRGSLERIQNTDGLLFYLHFPSPAHADVGNAIYSNVSSGNQTAEFFLNHNVSHVEDNMFLAFDNNFVAAAMARYAELQSTFTWYAINMLSLVAFAMFLFVVLLCGAGRKYRTEGVHFTPIDKPYLDISLFVVGLWAVIVFVILVEEVFGLAWRHGNIVALNVVFAIASIVIVSPILLWFMSFFKRLKAGKFWKHTLIYAILAKVIYRSLRFCVGESRNLWAGTKLTGKVAVISATSFIFIMFISIFSILMDMDGRGFIVVFPIIIGATATIVILLLRYSKRIHTLELGALRANEGDYETPIEVGGGELGRIAASINNISVGIGKAVDERMKSERMKAELITNVSHDIRTPLTSIITYTDLLKHEGLDSEKAPEYLDVLTQKSQRLKTLTDELFEAAKAASGNIDVDLSDLDIVALLNQVLGENDNAIKSSGLDIRTKFPAGKLKIRADGRLMQRVVENLLSNVCKYSLPDSRVYIDVLATEGSRMKLDIKNISATELNFDPSELTERFKRGDDSRSDGGSGLGLSIVQSFVLAQNGRFETAIDGDLFKATVTLPM